MADQEQLAQEVEEALVSQMHYLHRDVDEFSASVVATVVKTACGRRAPWRRIVVRAGSGVTLATCFDCLLAVSLGAGI